MSHHEKGTIDGCFMEMSIEKQYVTPAEFARAKGYGLNYVYALLSVGRVEGVKRDGKWLIAVAEVDRRGARYARNGAKNVGAK